MICKLVSPISSEFQPAGSCVEDVFFSMEKSLNTKCIQSSLIEEENEEPDSCAGVEIRVIAMKSKELLLTYKVYLRTDFTLKCFPPWPFIISFEAI